MTGPDSTTLAALDFALRAGLVALMLFLGAVVWRDQRHSVPGGLAAALALGIAAYALQSSPAFWAWPPVVRVPLALLSTGNAVVFWLFARAVFDDDFQLRAVHALGWATLAAAALFYRLPGAAPAMGWVIALGTMGFALLAFVQTVDSWRADLVEGRRRLRVFIVAAGALYSLVNMSMRVVMPESVAALWQGPADIAALSTIAVLAAWRLVGASPLSFPSAVRPTAVTALAPDVEAPAGNMPVDPVDPVEPAEQSLLASLERLMRHDRVYREEGLTIAVLARRLAVPEYRLRRAINQRLGYRNFSAFLNGHRLAEVRQALLDPARAEEPVLSLALEAGFQSLGPFNRAFKAETGLTPTEFRRSGGC